MAIQFVGWAENSAGATNPYSVSLTALTGGIDTAARTGDLVIVFFGWASTADGAPAVQTAGYTNITATGGLYANDTRDANFHVARKFMGATPDTSVSVNSFGNSANGSACTAYVFRGVDPTTPLDVAVVTITGTNAALANPAAITPITAGAWVIIGAGVTADPTPLTFTSPTGYGNQRSNTAIGSTMGYVVNTATKAWTSGAEDPGAWTGGESTTSDSWCAVTIALRPEITTRRARIGWAELEVPDAPRRAHIGWAELEVPNAPRRGVVGWAEMEVPTAPRRGVIGWAELELPNAPRRGVVGWAEMEVPTAPRRGVIGWAELETPEPPAPSNERRARVGWAELEVPDAPRRGIIGWAELELPNAPRRGVIGWAELETPNGPRRARIGWAELEIPTAPRRGVIGWAELQTPDAPRRGVIGWAQFEIPNVAGARFAMLSWVEFEVPHAPVETLEQYRERMVAGAIAASGGKKATMFPPTYKLGGPRRKS